MHEEKGVMYETRANVKNFNTDDSGKLVSVELDNGKTLLANACVAGIGAKPSTNFLGANSATKDWLDVGGFLVVDQVRSFMFFFWEREMRELKVKILHLSISFTRLKTGI